MAETFPSPLTGDPDVLEGDGSAYSRLASGIDDAIAELNSLSTGDFTSQALAALVEQQGGVGGEMARMQGRYRQAGAALTVYAGHLRDAQAQARSAIAMHGDVSGRIQALQSEIDDTVQLAQQQGPQQQGYIDQLNGLNAQMSGLRDSVSQAQDLWTRAYWTKVNAANDARVAIHNGDKLGDLDDGLMDAIGSLIPILELIDKILQTVLKIVSLIMTIAAFVVLALSLVFPILAPAAAALFGYAALCQLAIAGLAFLEFLMDGFNLMDLVIAGAAVVAAFGGAVAGSALGELAGAAVDEAADGLGEAASGALGDLAQQGVQSGVKAVTNAAVQDVLKLGGPGAKALYDSMSPAATGFLHDQLGGAIGDLKDAAASLGTDLGGAVADAGGDLGDALHLGDLSQSIQDSANSFLNQPEVASAIDAVQQTGSQITQYAGQIQHQVIDPGRQVLTQVGQAVHQDPTGIFSGRFDDAVTSGSTAVSHFQDHVFGKVDGVLSHVPGGGAVSGAMHDSVGGFVGDVQSSVTDRLTGAGSYGASW